MEVNVYGEVHVHTSDDVNLGKSAAEMRLIKRGVKNRDDNACQICGERDKPLEVHHIFPQSKYMDLMGDTSNLITVCQKCHRKYHDKYENAEGAVSFAKFMRDEAEFK